jgi:acetyl esterase/lipase
VRNVVVPTLAPHLPTEASSRAVVVLPGGAFHLLSMENEGYEVAERLRGHGVAAFVLKSRVVPTPADDSGFHQSLADAFVAGMEPAIAGTLPLAIADAERAMELVRGQGFSHVTALGFSAGARIVAELATAGPCGTRRLPSTHLRCSSAPRPMTLSSASRGRSRWTRRGARSSSTSSSKAAMGSG